MVRQKLFDARQLVQMVKKYLPAIQLKTFYPEDRQVAGQAESLLSGFACPATLDAFLNLSPSP